MIQFNTLSFAEKPSKPGTFQIILRLMRAASKKDEPKMFSHRVLGVCREVDIPRYKRQLMSQYNVGRGRATITRNEGATNELSTNSAANDAGISE